MKPETKFNQIEMDKQTGLDEEGEAISMRPGWAVFLHYVIEVYIKFARTVCQKKLLTRE